MMSDEARRLGPLHIFQQVIDEERGRGIEPELGACDLKDPGLGLHDTCFVGIDTIDEESAKEVIFLKDMVMVDATDIGEEVERRLPMQGTGPFDHRGIDLENSAPDIEEVILGAIMSKGITNRFDKVGTADETRFMIHAERVEFLLRGRGFLSGVSQDLLFRHRIVKGEKDIPDIKDDGVD